MNTHNETLNTIVVWAGAMVCCLLWGSAFPFIKLGYEAYGIGAGDTGIQILFAGIRFLLAGILAVLLGSLGRRRVLIPRRESVPRIFRLSLLQTVAQYVFFYLGLARTTGVRASIVEGTNVFLSLVVASLIFKQERLSPRKIIGCVVGFAGVLLINLTGSSGGGGNYLLGDVLVILSTVAVAFSSVLLKEYSQAEDPVVLSGYQFMLGGAMMIVAGLAMGGRLQLVTGYGIAILLYLAFVSAVAYSLWGILMKHNPISKVAVFGFMNPVFGVVLSLLLLDEGSGLGIVHLISLALVCGGIYIVQRDLG